MYLLYFLFHRKPIYSSQKLAAFSMMPPFGRAQAAGDCYVASLWLAAPAAFSMSQTSFGL